MPIFLQIAKRSFCTSDDFPDNLLYTCGKYFTKNHNNNITHFIEQFSYLNMFIFLYEVVLFFSLYF